MRKRPPQGTTRIVDLERQERLVDSIAKSIIARTELKLASDDALLVNLIFAWAWLKVDQLIKVLGKKDAG